MPSFGSLTLAVDSPIRLESLTPEFEWICVQERTYEVPHEYDVRHMSHWGISASAAADVRLWTLAVLHCGGMCCVKDAGVRCAD